tara:strand:- start:773 stop:1084 length:312 start_codon:yes stop_codon:yes gene_type:complete
MEKIMQENKKIRLIFDLDKVSNGEINKKKGDLVDVEILKEFHKGLDIKYIPSTDKEIDLLNRNKSIYNRQLRSKIFRLITDYMIESQRAKGIRTGEIPYGFKD